MKPVTVETVRARIEQFEHATNTMSGGFTLSINSQFELSCLRELLVLLKSRTVTVKLPEPFKLAKSSSGLTYYYADEVNEALSAAGIKVEAE